jgi:hypothetical protein
MANFVCPNWLAYAFSDLDRYKMRRVQKTKPLKKIPATDAIFDNVRQENQAADDSPDVVRISMDAKAKLDVGDFSSG